ncbi:Superoxide dismutase [Cu-Zn] OS=Tsukamurella paurometabola (strain ATCC 8368 / DSM / CCUG 35730/ CIP 100753 / JCM 10117 / KCTC 9821 / NBRC 16120 / NCIMB 702349 / NCTC 13040) OX=521096 GN=Tpau_3728 PE=3 SV=1 [Tsukamurella paurometabola]|uniref:Superoxide dismutase [Cu-Zn] n=1 Tax=Tsukamurella paurometabola (strain ATCC 8368 / DSM 20162 / CCUG 35730 / CIP 100753 / JCM 10117 / KCTC 9821 / NBRC 16120 / NCIMB 702349 / NCTC 13040) TaxID=521096 RepID=D5UYK3_TSUPD|nr:superoxide dismutase family protein [Tsukamurella paurometabola]ADG80306.1 superoxide dismutase copper/zinc binding protein [Tsukamurella paurometabola DSM 20162]SUP39202.1 Superoxide dismutase [Cu-Zn] precursor [Tsukamurella paurometabola]
MTKRQYLAPIAILPVAALALTGCVNSEKSAGAGVGTTPAVVSGATVPAEGPVLSNAPGHGEEKPGEGGAPSAGAAEASLVKPDGTSAGKATFTEKDGVVVIDVRVTGLPAGFHGMHIHEVGKCEPNSVAKNGAPGSATNFGSAGGHWQKAGATGHPMTGDLVSIYVNANGTGQTVTSTGAFTLADIKKNADGNALMIHEKADNFGNVPATKYANIVPGQPVPDEQTLMTGDAGGRIACGVIKVG